MNKYLSVFLMFVVSGCASGSNATVPPLAIATVAPLHDVYEATNVAIPTTSGNGSIIFALSENGSAGSNLSGEIVDVSQGTMDRAIVHSGTVTRTTSGATLSGIALDAYTNRTIAFSGALSSSRLSYTLIGATTTTGSANRVAPYVDSLEAFVAPLGFVGTFTFTSASTSCVNGTVYVAIDGAAADGSGLWAPQGAVGVGSPPSSTGYADVGVWDGAKVLEVENIGGSVLYPAPTLGVALTAFPQADANGGLSQFGATPCTASISP